MNSETTLETVETVETVETRDIHEGVTFLHRRHPSVVFAAPVVMALWQKQVFQAFQPPEVRRSA